MHEIEPRGSLTNRSFLDVSKVSFEEFEKDRILIPDQGGRVFFSEESIPRILVESILLPASS